MKKQTKKLISRMIAAGIITGNISMPFNSYADGFKHLDVNKNEKAHLLNGVSVDDVMAIPGLVSIKVEVGDKHASNPSVLIDSGNKYVGKTYGYAMFEKYNAIEFIKWLVEKEPKYEKVFNLEKIYDIAETDEFDKLWLKASNMNKYDFALYQQLYIKEKLINPMIDKIKKETGIDIHGHRGLEETIYQIVIKYGLKGLDFLKESLKEYSSIEEVDFDKVTEKMLELELDYIESRNSFSDNAKEALKRASQQKTEYLKEIHDFSVKYKVEKDNRDAKVDNKDKSKNSLFNLISNIFKF